MRFLLLLAAALVACRSHRTHGPQDTEPEGGSVASTEHLPLREVCNGVDDDGDGLIDEDALVMPTWHHDGDGDGFGSGRDVVTACDPPDSSWVANGNDCDDTSALAYPGAQNDGICDNGIGDCAGDLGCRYEEGHFLDRARASWDDPLHGDIRAVAAAGDQDGDGRGDLVVGGTHLSTYEDDEDAVHVDDKVRVLHWSERGFSRFDSGGQVEVVATSTAGGLGNQLSYAGDTTGDGRGEVLISGLDRDSGDWSYWLAEHLDHDSLIEDVGPRLYPGFPANTSSSAGDVDGDGGADILLAYGGRVALYLGEPGGVEAAPHAILDGEDNDVAVTGLGDTDGDGLSDFAVSQENSSHGAYISGVVYVYTVAPSGDVTLGDGGVTLWGGEAERAGTSLDGAGDVNGDGYDDVLIGSTTAMQEAEGYANTVAAHLLLGPVAGGPLTNADLTIVSETGIDATHGAQAVGLGDLDGDGFADFGFGAGVAHYREGDGWWGGGLEMFYGPGPRGTVTFDAAEAWLYGTQATFANVGDFDGDGGPDVAFAADNHLWLFLGQQP